MEIQKAAGTRENELARLIFLANDLSSVQRLQRYLDRHPDLWLVLSEPLRSAVEQAVADTYQLECLVNGSRRFTYRPADHFPLYTF